MAIFPLQRGGEKGPGGRVDEAIGTKNTRQVIKGADGRSEALEGLLGYANVIPHSY